LHAKNNSVITFYWQYLTKVLAQKKILLLTLSVLMNIVSVRITNISYNIW